MELTAIELNDLLKDATPVQTDIVFALRDLVLNNSTLTEIVNHGKWLDGYLFYMHPEVEMIYCIGLTANNTVSMHLLPLYTGQTKYEEQFKPFRSGKSCLKFKSVDDLPIKELEDIIKNSTPVYVEFMKVHRAKKSKK